MKKVASGQPLEIPADTYNAFIDAARAHQADRQGDSVAGSTTVRQTGIVRIRNDSGADLDAFAVLGIDGPLVTPTENQTEFDYRPALVGSTPDITTHLGKFAVLAEPIPDGKIGRAYIDGFCPALVDVADEDHQYADVDDGATAALASGASGAQILWKDSGTGVVSALVRLGASGGATIRHFELKTYLDTGYTATAYPREWDGSDYVTDTSSTFTVLDVLGQFRGQGRDAAWMSQGFLGWARNSNGIWEIGGLQAAVTHLRGTVSEEGGVTLPNTAFTVDNIEIVSPAGGRFLFGEDVAWEAEVYNSHQWALEDGAQVEAVYDVARGRWQAWQADCPPLTY